MTAETETGARRASCLAGPSKTRRATSGRALFTKGVDMNATGIRWAFLAGWYWGRCRGVELSAREIQERHPAYTAAEVGAFAQGHLDGIDGDRFRLER